MEAPYSRMRSLATERTLSTGQDPSDLSEISSHWHVISVRQRLQGRASSLLSGLNPPIAPLPPLLTLTLDPANLKNKTISYFTSKNVFIWE